MRLLTLILIMFILVNCSVPNTEIFSDNLNERFISQAHNYVNMTERKNRKELRELMGVDPVRTEWCAAFVNSILELENTQGSGSVHHNPMLARSFLVWGESVSKHEIKRGDVVVFPRGTQGWQGHVGFYYGTTEDGLWIILSGNYNGAVKYAKYRPSYAIGIRRAHKKSNS